MLLVHVLKALDSFFSVVYTETPHVLNIWKEKVLINDVVVILHSSVAFVTRCNRVHNTQRITNLFPQKNVMLLFGVTVISYYDNKNLQEVCVHTSLFLVARERIYGVGKKRKKRSL